MNKPTKSAVTTLSAEAYTLYALADNDPTTYWDEEES